MLNDVCQSFNWIILTHGKRAKWCQPAHTRVVSAVDGISDDLNECNSSAGPMATRGECLKMAERIASAASARLLYDEEDMAPTKLIVEENSMPARLLEHLAERNGRDQSGQRRSCELFAEFYDTFRVRNPTL
jgi:hypothetical protein